MSIGTSFSAAGTTGGARGSRHYRRAQQDRGADTRERLLLAALDAFGRYGFEAASTRDIARRADANLAAIVYHFGSKEALHLAVAEHVVGQMRRRTGAVLAEIDVKLDAGGVGKPEARRLLHTIFESFVETLVGDREAELWGRFIMREQMEPSPVFDVTFAYVAAAHHTMHRLVGLLLDQDPSDPVVVIRVFALLGEISIFCGSQPLFLRMLGTTTLERRDRDLIVRIATENIDRIIGVSSPETARE